MQNMCMYNEETATWHFFKLHGQGWIS